MSAQHKISQGGDGVKTFQHKKRSAKPNHLAMVSKFKLQHKPEGDAPSTEPESSEGERRNSLSLNDCLINFSLSPSMELIPAHRTPSRKRRKILQFTEEEIEKGLQREENQRRRKSMPELPRKQLLMKILANDAKEEATNQGEELAPRKQRSFSVDYQGNAPRITEMISNSSPPSEVFSALEGFPSLPRRRASISAMPSNVNREAKLPPPATATNPSSPVLPSLREVFKLERELPQQLEHLPVIRDSHFDDLTQKFMQYRAERRNGVSF